MQLSKALEDRGVRIPSKWISKGGGRAFTANLIKNILEVIKILFCWSKSHILSKLTMYRTFSYFETLPPIRHIQYRYTNRPNHFTRWHKKTDFTGTQTYPTWSHTFSIYTHKDITWIEREKLPCGHTQNISSCRETFNYFSSLTVLVFTKHLCLTTFIVTSKLFSAS